MFTMDMPSVPAQNAPVVMVVAGASVSATPADSTQQADYLVKMCEEKSSAEEKNTLNFVTPAEMVIVQIGNKEHRYIDLSAAISQTTLIKTAEHGKLVQETTKNGKVFFTYEPELDYVGKDKAIFMVEYAGKRYKVILTLEVSTLVDNNTPLCPEPEFIKVTKPSSGSSGFDLNSISVNLADLTGGAVGQATGTNITLDDNAAGHNWFIDTTPSAKGVRPYI